MFAVSSIRPVRPVSRGLLALAVLGMLLASLLPVANATPFAPRAALASHTAAPTTVTIAGSLQAELGCPGDWQPDCAATHLAYDADDDVWQGTFAVPAGQLGVQGRAQRRAGTRTTACTTPGGDNIPLNLRRRPDRQVLLRPQDALGHRQRHLGDRHRARQLPEPSSAAPATGSPTACARGSRTPTATAPTPSRRPASRPAATRPRSRSTRAGTRTTAQGGVPGRRQHPVHRPGQRRQGHLQLRRRDPRPDDQSASRTTATTTTSSGTACATTRATRSTGRRAARSRPGTPVTLRFRTFHDDVTGVKARFYSVDASGAADRRR